ncbi:MAG TPA: DAK2 domain-containing protein [Anaeromyxobacteraceae bacterium]|nr:DAK2 domain-containing protein [Anaeromyxobacteraceae bacterium]
MKDALRAEDLVALLARLKALMEEKKEFLIELDGKVGDSDLGLTMSKGLAAASDAVAGTAEPPGKLLARAGMAIARAAPSTMGTLTATGFMRGGKALEGVEAVGTAEMRRFWRAFLDGVVERGKARPGDKTVVDAHGPLVAALERAEASGARLGEALDAAVAAAAGGVEATKSMVSQRGRAAAFQEKTRGIPDAGATVALLIVEAFRDFVAAPST